MVTPAGHKTLGLTLVWPTTRRIEARAKTQIDNVGARLIVFGIFRGKSSQFTELHRMLEADNMNFREDLHPVKVEGY